MYKLICANIAKSRNFTHSYKKVALANRIHLDASRPQSAPPSTSLEENGEELNEEENGAPIRSRARNQKPAKVSKPHPSLSHLVKPEPPAAGISKKNFHMNAISSPTKRTCFTQGPRNSNEEQARESYRRAMKQLYNMQQDKPEFQFKEPAVHPLETRTKRALSLQQTKQQKKVAGKTGITYPTHTYKHNLTLSRRYRLREGSAERKVRELEEEFMKRMRMQRKMFKTITAKTITYPNLVENLKKSRPLGEREPPQPERPIIKVAPPAPQQTAKESDTSIKSHPIIGAASKEAKMKLKSKFVQLLLRSARSCTQPQDISTQESEDTAQLAEPTEAGSVLDDFPMKYPKTVWMNDINTSHLSLEDVCFKTGRASGKDLVGKPTASQMEEQEKEREEAVETPHELKMKQTATDLTKSDASLGNFTRGDLRQKIIRNRARQAVGKRATEAARALLYHTERKGTSRCEDSESTGARNVPEKDNFLCKESETSPKAEPDPKASTEIDDVLTIKPPTDPNAVETKYEDLFLLVRAQKRLDQPTQVEELNENAREKEAACIKQRQKEAEQQHVEDLKNQAQSLPSLKTPNVVPRIDKVNDRLEEQSQIAENAKNKIQSLTRFPRPAVIPPKKRLVLFKRAPESKSRLDSHSKYEKLNQAAREWAEKHRKRPVPNSYTLEQSSAKAPKPEKLRTRESDLKEGQFQKTQAQLEEFCQKKSQEWNQKSEEKSEWAALRAKRILKGPIEVIEVLAPTTFIKEENVILFAPSKSGKVADEEKKSEGKEKKAKPTDTKPEKEDTNEDTKKNEHQGFALYPPFPKHGAAKEDISNLKPQEDERKQAEGLQPTETPTQEISYQTADVSKAYQEHVLRQFFNAKLLPERQQSVYMPQERLIINNIKETEEQNYQEDDRKSDGAVLRPGDEIVFLGNSGQSTNELSSILPNRLEKALVTSESFGCKLALAENKALMDTRAQIDDMMKKISQLEIMVKEQQQSLAKEEQLANKIRAPPPKRPEDKDKKKEERPKGPNDLVLPPKGRSWKPDEGSKRQKEATSEENCVRSSELSGAKVAKKEQIEEHTEKFGQVEATVKAPYSAQSAAWTGGKKIIKTPKCQSLTFTKVEEQKTAGKHKLESNKSTYEALHFNSQLTTGRKIGAKRPASCPPAGPRVKKSDQPASKSSKTHLEAGRTKFSSWSTCKFPSPSKNAPAGLHQGEPKSIKRAASDEAADSSKSSSAQPLKSRKSPTESSKSYLQPDYSISKIVKRLPLKTIKGPQLEEELTENPPLEEKPAAQPALEERVASPSDPVPKVLKTPVKKPKSVVELYTQRIQDRSKRKTHEENDNSKQALQPSEDSNTPKEVADSMEDQCGCVADSNLKQADPIGTLIVTLPQKCCSRSPQGHTLNATGYKSERTFFTGKTTITKAPISTSSGPKMSDGKNKPPKKEKTAIFRIQSDGEVFIVKKADESSGKAANRPQTYDYMDRVKNQVEVHEAKLEPKLADEEEQRIQAGPHLKAKIRTIYNKDQSRKISESTKNPVTRPENRPQTWRPLFGDLSAPDFQQIRDEFFQHPLKEKFIKPQSISTDVLKKKPQNLPENQPSTQEPSGECDSMHLNKRYSQMLRNIGIRLAEKRKNATNRKLAEKSHLEEAPQTGDLYTLKAPQQKIPLTQKIRDTLYQVSQPPRAHSFATQEATLAQKKRSLYDSILKVSASTQKLIAHDKLNLEVKSWSLSLLNNVETRKSLTGRDLEENGPKSIAPPPQLSPQNRSSCSKVPQVKKLISEVNLAGEVESWGMSLLHNMEKQKPASAIAVKELPPRDIHVNERFCKPNTKMQFKVVSEQPKREPSKYPLHNEERFMYVEKSMRKKLQKPAERTKPGSVAAATPKRADSPKPVNQVSTNQFRKTFTVLSGTEMEKRRKRQELEETVSKGKKELNVQQQEQRSKKGKVGQMNSAALEILRKKSIQDREEISKGTRRQYMYGSGAKVVKPSVGNGPWGNKIRPSSVDVDKKRFHSGTHINRASNNEVLMSRAEFLRLKKAASERKVLQPSNHTVEEKKEKMPDEISQAKVTIEEENQKEHAQQAADKSPNAIKQAIDLHQNASSKLLNDAPDLKSQAKNQFQLMFPEARPKSEETKAGLEKLGAEIEKFFEERPSGGPVSSQQRQKSEFAADLEPPKDTPRPELTTDGLHYKITQMTKAIVDDLRVQESLKHLTDQGELGANEKTKSPEAKGKLKEILGHPEFSKCDNKCGAIIKCVVYREESPNTTDSPPKSEEDSQKSAVDKMVDLKRKNKASRRLKSTSLQNMILQPEGESPPIPDPDKEEPTIVKEANFIFKQPKPRENRKSPKAPCQQLVLPMKKPTFQGGGLLEHQSTLDKPLGDAIKSVPKEMNIQKPDDALRRAKADPLSRYRHLRITYLTINRPNREADRETFLPIATKSPKETASIHEEEKNRILNYRFQLLKRLNEDFQKQQQQDRLLPPLNSQETTVGGDSVWDVKSYLEEEMKATRTIFKERSRSASTSKTIEKKAGVVPLKTNDDKDKPGGRRCFSTDSQKGADETGLEICQSQLTLPETDAKPPETCEEGFDVLEAVPEAFECPSQQLEEDRQQNLYYRYHKWSFADLHNYLQQHRVSSVDASAQSGKQ